MSSFSYELQQHISILRKKRSSKFHLSKITALNPPEPLVTIPVALRLLAYLAFAPGVSAIALESLRACHLCKHRLKCFFLVCVCLYRLTEHLCTPCFHLLLLTVRLTGPCSALPGPTLHTEAGFSLVQGFLQSHWMGWTFASKVC